MNNVSFLNTSFHLVYFNSDPDCIWYFQYPNNHLSCHELKQQTLSIESKYQQFERKTFMKIHTYENHYWLHDNLTSYI